MGPRRTDRGSFLYGANRRYGSIALAYLRLVYEKAIGTGIRSLLLYNHRARAVGDRVWELGVGHRSTGYAPPGRQSSRRYSWSVLRSRFSDGESRGASSSRWHIPTMVTRSTEITDNSQARLCRLRAKSSL